MSHIYSGDLIQPICIFCIICIILISFEVLFGRPMPSGPWHVVSHCCFYLLTFLLTAGEGELPSQHTTP